MAQGVLEWLADADRHLRYQGELPDNEDTLMQMHVDHEVVRFLCFKSHLPSV